MAVRLYCATSNAGKLLEFQQAAGDGIAIHGLPPVPCPESGATFEENAVLKAVCYSEALRGAPEGSPLASPLLFADDSGLVVDALEGAPGIHSARFAGPGADDAANNSLLLEKLSHVPGPRRTASFVCCIALSRGGGVIQTFQAEVKGMILDEQRGSGGFGYDPLFYLPELGRAFAELTPEQKWMHSHRGHAFEQLLSWLRQTEEGGSTAGL
ncbi:MAG: non-canonical purine NTP pyrophosphatase [Acidobacteria bacterium]|nr:non-canonical purine NTP pyrophosphatase [Acidobacteriota bacterium]